MSDFKPGQLVHFNTNFYPEPEHQTGTGVVDRTEKCGNEGGCACGVGGTVFVKLPGGRTLAYVAKELTPA